jgi:hypothetical protein
MCLEEITLRAQNLITIPSSKVNMIGENLYDLNDLRNYKTNDSGIDLVFQTISY